MEHRDTFHYVKSINHAFDYGGSFTTTLALEAERSIAYDFDPDNNRFEVSRNMVYKLKEPFNLTPDKSLNKKQTTKQQTSNTTDKNAKLSELSKGANFVSAMGTGRYALKEGTVDEQTITPTSVPYSDEEGYKVIGSFRYGRGIIVKAGAVVGVDLPPVNGQTAAETALLRQAQLITNMRTVADEESSEMGAYFAVNKQTSVNKDTNPYGIENLIPTYLDLENEFYKGEQTNPTEITISYTEQEEIINGKKAQAAVGGNPTFLSSDAASIVKPASVKK
jgi:hypothetical protein